MVYLVHGRCRILGLAYGGSTWSIGINVAQVDGTDPFANGTLDVQGALESWADTVKGLNGGSIFPQTFLQLLGHGQITGVRCSRIGTDGKETAVALVELGAPVNGSNLTPMPGSVALCVSLLSGRPGASYRGRLYLPAFSAGLGANGRLTNPVPNDVATEAAAFIKSVSDGLPLGVGSTLNNAPAVVSSKGHTIRVASVRVGNRLDSQRRRTESEKEAYSSAAVAQ